MLLNEDYSDESSGNLDDISFDRGSKMAHVQTELSPYKPEDGEADDLNPEDYLKRP